MTHIPALRNCSSSTPKSGGFATRQGRPLRIVYRDRTAAVVIAEDVNSNIRGFIKELKRVGS
jgi:hypothetical protein